jgi:hypothetical protein
MEQQKRTIIGRSALVTLGGISDIPAKVDTGADSSAVWASNVHVRDGDLYFTLLGPGSKGHTGKEMVAAQGTYELVRVASSSGERQTRYAVPLSVVAEGETVIARFTLADRLTMSYPVLLGQSFLANRFLVDVTKHISVGMHQALIAAKHRRTRIVTEDKE